MSTAFDYAAFIDELRELVVRAREFRPDERSLKSESFRRWRHETEELIHRINRLRYDIACGIEGRSFQVMAYGSISAREQQAKFDDDMNDTVAELELAIGRFDKYGDPKVKPAARDKDARPAAEVSTRPLPLAVPEKVTIGWLLAHVPVTWYVTLAAACVVIFGAGMTVASTKLGKALVEWVTPAPSTEKPTGRQ
ncbi:hypothetical protein RI103_35030 [Paraburkholderia sp. FT54]|uniref:hypothetical protein n=1 Tax=Paraburkholderia sp. FT54 TaxID=3074437 RepID=UPI002877BBD3|nr:hypothetical protein [Paraburkholderia sp. FT54]WNC94389.1 hypothetical protein RI103_35030 [Paraburkholderia sp. FT54]